MYYDLRTVCYEEFLDFIFDHPVAPQFRERSWGRAVTPANCWYDSIGLEVDLDVARNCEYFALLFCDPRGLLDRYDRGQIEQGLWWMQTGYNDGSVADILRADSLPAPRKVAMVRAMYFLYADLFAVEPLGNAPHMWWESLLRGFPDQAAGVSRWCARQRVQDAMFETLAQMLSLSAENCRIDALHGLNHLAHSGKERLIRDYLGQHDGLDETHRRYAERAIGGVLL